MRDALVRWDGNLPRNAVRHRRPLVRRHVLSLPCAAWSSNLNITFFSEPPSALRTSGLVRTRARYVHRRSLDRKPRGLIARLFIIKQRIPVARIRKSARRCWQVLSGTSLAVLEQASIAVPKASPNNGPRQYQTSSQDEGFGTSSSRGFNARCPRLCSKLWVWTPA